MDSLNHYDSPNQNYANPNASKHNLNDLNNNHVAATGGGESAMPAKPKLFILNNLNSNYTNASLNDLHRISTNHSANVAFVNAVNSNNANYSNNNNNNHMHHSPAHINNFHPSMKNRNFHINLVDRSSISNNNNSPQTPTFPVDELNESMGKNMYKLNNVV